MKKYTITADSGILTLHWLLPPDLEDLKIMLRELTDNCCHSGSPLLIVDSGTAYNPPTGILEASVDILREFIPPLKNRIALVVRKELHYGLGRMLEVLCSAREICFRVFRDLEEARGWLLESEGEGNPFPPRYARVG